MKKTPVEMLEEVLDKQHELFEDAVARGDAADILDIGAEIGKTASALLRALDAEASRNYLEAQTKRREQLAKEEEKRLKEAIKEINAT